VQNMPHQDLPLGDSAGLVVGESGIVLAQTLRSFERPRRDTIRFAGAPPGPEDRNLPRDVALAWIHGRRIVGTAAAKALAPWLIDDVVEILATPETSAP
jgi:hypothetical protein